MSWLLTVEMIRIFKNNSGGKMQLAICWSGSSHFHLWRQKFNCSSHFVTQFIDVLFGVIHSRTLLEILLSVIVTHSNVLLTSPDTPALVWHLLWTQYNISMWWLQLYEQSNNFPQQDCYCRLLIVMHISNLHWWIMGRVCYMHRNNHTGRIIFQYVNVWRMT